MARKTCFLAVLVLFLFWSISPVIAQEATETTTEEAAPSAGEATTDEAPAQEAEEIEAEVQEAETPPAPPIVAVPLSAEDLDAFMSGYMEALLEAENIAGATLSIVQNGEVLLAKGFGMADVENQIPVDPATTLFRIGSISKLFVWTTVMQEFEKGRLSLNTDINTYMEEVQVPATYDTPVTLTHLLTHTPGFEDKVIGLFRRTAEEVIPLKDVLVNEMPMRVRPPGELASYSNHGTGMAAHIVARVASQDWMDYVEQNVILPLGMHHTTFRQPVPDSIAAGMSKGYAGSSSGFEEQGFEYIPLAPVGAASASATDMATFMMMMLNQGQLGDVTIMSPTTMHRMQEPLFQHAASVNASAHGFYEMSQNGYRLIGHGGDTIWFHSQMALIPEQNVGLFVSFNTDNGGGESGEVIATFMDRYFPDATSSARPSMALAPAQLERFAGTYRAVRYSHSSIAKLAALMGTFDVTVTEDGRLHSTFGGNRDWIQEDDLTFREADGDDRIAFRPDESGRITHLFVSSVPIIGFERVGMLGQPSMHMGILGIGMALFGITFLLWPTVGLVRRWYQYSPPARKRIPIAANFLLWTSCALFVLFAVGLGITLSSPNDVVFGLSAQTKLLFWLPIVAGVFVLGMLIYTPFLWIKGHGTVPRRIWFTVVTIGGLAVTWSLYYWNMLGFNF